MRTLSISELARLFGLPVATLRQWVVRGIITPTEPSTGRPVPDRFDAMLALRVAVMGMLRRRGIPFSGAFSAAKFLGGKSLDDLQAAFADNRDCLLVVGDTTCPRLLSWDALAGNQHYFAESERHNLPVAVVDIRAAVDILFTHLAKIEDGVVTSPPPALPRPYPTMPDKVPA